MRYGGSNPPLCTISFASLAVVVAGVGECCGSKPGRQRQDVDCAGRFRVVGASSLANDGARQVSTVDLDPGRFFCLPCHTRTAAFAVRLFGKSISRLFLVLYDAGVAQW